MKIRDQYGPLIMMKILGKSITLTEKLMTVNGQDRVTLMVTKLCQEKMLNVSVIRVQEKTMKELSESLLLRQQCPCQLVTKSFQNKV